MARCDRAAEIPSTVEVVVAAVREGRCLLADKQKLVWETLDQEGGSVLNLRRAKVPGGWLFSGGDDQRGWSLVFVPDAKHLWLAAGDW